MQSDARIDDIKKEVEFLYNSYSHTQASKDSAFTQWVIQLLFPSIDADQAFRLVMADSDININAYYQDDQSGVFYLIYARYADDENEKFGPGIIYGALDIFRQIKSPVSSYTDNKILSEALQAYEDGYELSMIIVLFGLLDETVNVDFFRDKYQLGEQELDIHDANELKKRLSSLENFTNETVSVSFLSQPTSYDGPIQAIVGNVNAYQYRELVRKLGSQIYDANLRSPLGKTTRINKDMEETLSSNSTKKDYFWYYNNGITILCKELQPVSGNPYEYKIDSPRIVNGSQTTNAIRYAEFSPDTSVAVMLRIIAALPGSNQISEEMKKSSYTTEDLYLDIAKFTNSQNPMQSPDFRSNEHVQKSLEKNFRELGWFYERKRGDYNSSKTSIPRTHCISMEDLAQRWYAFDGNPAIAIREKKSLFDNKGRYNSVFIASRPVEAYLTAYLVFDQIEELLIANIKEAKNKYSSSIIAGEKISIPGRYYLAIGRATMRSVAHMTALLGKAIEEKYGSMDKKRELAPKVLKAVNSNKFIQQIYPELADALFRTIDSLEKGKTLHNELSEEESFDRLYEFFSYGLEKEQSRGRDIINIEQFIESNE